jgi:hypothetical protein
MVFECDIKTLFFNEIGDANHYLSEKRGSLFD